MEARNTDWWHHFPVPFSCPQKSVTFSEKNMPSFSTQKCPSTKNVSCILPHFFQATPPPKKKKNNVSHLPNSSWESKGTTLPNATPSHKIRPYEQFMNHYDSWCLNHPLDSHNFRRLHHTPKRPSRLLGPIDVSLPIHPQFRRKLSEITARNRSTRRGCSLTADESPPWKGRPVPLPRPVLASPPTLGKIEMMEVGGYKNSHGVIVPILEKYQVPLFMEVMLTLLRHYLDKHVKRMLNYFVLEAPWLVGHASTDPACAFFLANSQLWPMGGPTPESHGDQTHALKPKNSNSLQNILLETISHIPPMEKAPNKKHLHSGPSQTGPYISFPRKFIGRGDWTPS